MDTTATPQDKQRAPELSNDAEASREAPLSQMLDSWTGRLAQGAPTPVPSMLARAGSALRDEGGSARLGVKDHGMAAAAGAPAVDEGPDATVAHEAYFRRVLGDVDEPTIPFGVIAARGGEERIGMAAHRLASADAERIHAAARAVGVAPSVLFHVAFAQVLAHCTGRDDVVFGTALSGHSRGTGAASDALPLRVTLGSADPASVVAETRARLAELLQHAAASSELARRCSGVSDTLPLFTALLDCRGPAAHADRAGHPLVLIVEDAGQAVALEVRAAAGMDATRIIGYVKRAVTGLADALLGTSPPALMDVDVLPAAERELLLDVWNRNEVAFDLSPCLHELVERQAARTPDTIAAVHGDERITYAELNRRANQLARRLRADGVAPDMLVALHIDRSLAMVTALLAVLKAGGAFVPLDPDFPADRLSYMLTHSRARVLLTTAALEPALAGQSDATTICLDRDWPGIAALDDTDLACVTNPRNRAYMIYTSGSTGRPKGALLRHDGALNHMLAKALDLGLEGPIHFLQNAPSSSDVSVWQMLLPLITGGRTAVLSDPMDFPGLMRTTRENRLTIIEFVPSLLTHFIQWAQRQPEAERALPDLRYMMVMGDVVSVQLINSWLAVYPDAAAINAYGPTEASDDIMENVIRSPLPSGQLAVPIGRPLANLSLYVLDKQRRPVPLGVPGELYVAGIGVGEGYLDDPAKTAAAFFDNPFDAARPRMYRTGDIAQYLPDGQVHFMGRVDHQVKIRGFRIELGEIEARLTQCAGVREVVVVARELEDGNKQLVAYLTMHVDPATGRAGIDRNRIRADLEARLPDYMVPAAFVRLDALPLTPNGKLDRKALPVPDDESYARSLYEAPQGPVEEAIAALWSQVLRIDRVGRQDDFFKLGGHSLLAASVMARLREQFGLELRLGDLFLNSRVQALAERIEAARSAREILRIPAIGVASPQERERGLPLSFAQQRLWSLCQLPGQSEAYHLPVGLRLDGPLDTAALRRALDRMVRRHEVLRSHIELHGNEPVQVIHPAEGAVFALQEVDLTALAPDAQSRAARSRAHAHNTRTFDLGRGPLLRGLLLRRGPECHELHIVQHHIVSDGWSEAIFAREFSALYAAYRLGQDDPLEPLAIQYGDYAAWQRRWFDVESLQTQSHYWQEQLRGAPELLELPTDFPRPPQSNPRGGEVAIDLGAGLTRSLKALSQDQGCTLHQTLLAAWAVVLSKLSGQRDVVIGTPSANRDQAQLEGLVGFFVNTLPLRLRLEDNPSIEALLRQARQVAVAAQDRQQLPLEQIIEIVKPTRSLAYNPIFQVSFTWENNAEAALAFPGVEVSPTGQFEPAAKYDVELVLAEGAAGTGVKGLLGYASALFSEASIVRHAACLKRVLQAFVEAHSARRLGQATFAELDMLGAEERDQLLQGFNETAEHGTEGLVHALFEAQARRTPDAMAVASAQGSLSYAELNTRANQLAHRLIALGVRPDDRVAICVERSLEMIVGLMGILKAGAAYVPLDPAYPEERLLHMVHDSDPRALLSHARVDAALLARLARADATPTLLLDADADLWHDAACTHDPDPHRLNLEPDHAAYVTYTSGSTGVPKGVLATHAGLANLIGSVRSLMSLTTDDRFLQFASAAFDVCAEEVFTPLSCGARLVLRDERWMGGAEAFWSLCKESGITVADLPVRFWEQMVADGHGRIPRELRCLIVGGEAVSASSVQQWFGRDGHKPRLINAYGPTETTVNATCHVCSAEDATNVPIGRPIAKTRIYLLDEFRQPVPLGAVGEIWIGGAGVARGYLNRPELTAERFLADPFSAKPGARMYRTGDLGRYRADGAIEFRGRNDFQVKMRGFRIELGEIEVRLTECPDVRAAVVLARELDDGDKQLVAYLTAQDGADLDLDRIRADLQASLPEYMVPAAFVRLDGLPLTPNGKLDRQALPAPDDASYVRGQFEAPRGAVEETVAGIWAQVLKLERVGRQDDFFDLGGNSLLAVRVMARLRAEGLQVDVSDLFGGTTLAALAAKTEGAGAQAVIPENRIPEHCRQLTPDLLPLIKLTQSQIDHLVAQVPGGVANIQDVYPLAPLQEGMLFHHLLQTHGDVYITPSVLEFDDRARLDRWVAAHGAVVRRHDALRTGVYWEGLPEPVQLVQREAPLAVHEVVLDARDPASGAQQLLARFDSRSYRMDLRRAPLLELHAAQDPRSGAWLLLMLSHHIWGDNESQELLDRETDAFLLGQADALPAPVPFREFVAQARRGVDQDEHQAFFKSLLGDVDEPTLPYGLREVRGTGADVRECVHALPAELGQRIRERVRREGVSAASLFHLAWALVLAKLSGREDVVFGTQVLGRMQGGEAAARGLGMFINTLPMRVKLQSQGAQEALKQAHQTLAQLMRHEHASLALAQRCSGVAAPTPLFSALMNFRHNRLPAQGREAQALPEALRGMRWVGGHDRTNYPVALNVDDNGVDAGFSISPQLANPYDPERVAGYVQAVLERLLTALEQAPATPAGDLDILPSAERELLLHGFNPAPSVVERPALVKIFQDWARRQPDAVALAHGAERMSYGALDQAANQLAHHLLALGVRQADRVLLALPRGGALLGAELALLKLGAAFVPVDASQPPARLAALMADALPDPGTAPSRPRLVLTLAATVLPALDSHGRAVQRLDLDAIELRAALRDRAAHSHDLPPVPAAADAVAYVMYTSGSTGTPKGVEVLQRNLAALTLGNAYADLGPSDVLALTANTSFDGSTFEIFTALMNGASMVAVDQETLLDPAAFADLVQRSGVTFLHMVSGVVANHAPALRGKLHRVRYLLTGGDRLDIRAARSILEESGIGCLLFTYGPTEATTFATCETVHRIGDDVAALAIGRPIANARVYLLDARRQPVPLGAVGEVWIGGAGVARGYLHRPDLTAERFLPDPFDAQPGARMYKTGDLARQRTDGAIEYLGRNDLQVKIRGFRIELGEIEARLGRCAGVREAVVLARESGNGGKRLVAYLTAHDGAELELNRIRTELQAGLPEYMVPATFVRMGDLPLTPNGKLDRKALPAPRDEAYERGRHELPQGSVEEAVAAVWAQVLGLDRVGRHDDFFELGGHSLLAVPVMARLVDAGHRIDLADLYRVPTVAGLAEVIRQRTGLTQWDRSLLRIREPRAGEPPLFLVHEIQGVDAYFLNLGARLDERLGVYGIAATPLDQAPLQSMERLAERVAGIVERAQPTGPCRLAGWSFGGTLAYMAAWVLRSRGRAVQFVGLFDSRPSHPDPAGHKTPCELVIEDVQELAASRPGLAPAPAEWADLRQLAHDADFDALWTLARALPVLADRPYCSFPHDQAKRFYERWAAHETAAGHRAPASDLALHLFVARDEASPPPTDYLGWDAVVPVDRISKTVTPGDHHGMLAAEGALADALNRHLLDLS